jgi:hypothetical protein
MKTNLIDYDGFLELPDYQKVELKMRRSKFTTFPLMSKETFAERQNLIYCIAAHFGQMDVHDLMTDPNKTLDNAWPRFFESFLTPKLLDYLDLKFFTQFGKCYCCTRYIGFNKMHYKMLGQKGNKIVPISGRCKQRFDEEALYRNEKITYEIVSPDYVCLMWHPQLLYFNSFQYLIESKLKSITEYPFDEYLLDLKHVDFWRYFFNKFHF